MQSKNLENNKPVNEKLNNLLLQNKTGKKKYYIGSYALVCFFMAVVLIAVYIAVITSLMTKAEANFVEFHWIPEQGISFRAYIEAFTKDFGGTNVMIGLKNTLIIYLPGIIVGLYVSAVAAFAFAKMKFPFKVIMFSILMGTMMIPQNMNIIARVLMFDQLDWIGTPWPIMIPRMFGTIGVIYFLKQYYMTIPKDLIDAARIDGLSYFGVFNRIMLPISVSPLLIQFIFQFIAGYNDYNDPLYFLTSNANLHTVQLTLAFLVDPYEQDWPLRMAAPMFLLYLFTQNLMLKGLDVSSSIKG